ncbi:MAG TPA: isoleucine--tRNA ligase [Xanthobacteraceae bacterium]|nr:isoleucine--tRNA ligase [Xanthobacteraceae bacterium]
MSEHSRDYSETLFLPKTDFPMRAGLPQKEPEILAHWERIGLYARLREASGGRTKFVLHDGPPYANGNVHIGTALNKVLKDVVTRSQQMLGYDSNYVPGWDCHGLPIEWKIEEENYRAKGRQKPDLTDPAAMIAFRRECRAYAEHWLNVQREEFKRLGGVGDWAHPYTTMDYAAEAQIARELMKFAANGTLYRGSKPVMWSVVEKTALAEAEVEYEDFTSDQVWVKFPIDEAPFGPLVDFPDADAKAALNALRSASVVIWTTTPWTLPGNRAISYSHRMAYGLFEVTDAPEGNWAKPGDQFLLADKLADEVAKQAKVVSFKRLFSVTANMLEFVICRHPLNGRGYDFHVPLLAGEHVTDDVGTGFVHTAPGHGRDDFDIWTANARKLARWGIDTTIPYTVDGDGFFTDQAPGFGPRDTGGKPKRVITDKGDKGDANDAVIKALIDAGMLIARGRLKHQYPHSWRSKKPVIFRNTPQWFIAMDKPIGSSPLPEGERSTASAAKPAGEGHSDYGPASTPSTAPTLPSPPGEGKVGATSPRWGEVKAGDTLRHRALAAIRETRWVPPQGENRITGMIDTRPDWVISRQRAWGVPIAVFAREHDDGSVEVLNDERVNARIAAAFEREGADAWYAPRARERFLGELANEEWQKVDDILDVWFDSGSTHAFTLEDPKHFPGLAGIRRRRDGGPDTVMYLEGSDQHRGWFQSSLLESCGTRGVAPFDVVLTHGFVLDEHGRKMSKSLGNTVAPQDVIKSSGADILRMWVCASDYADDLRIGPEILKTTVDTYRKLRNTIRWMLGNLAHFREEDRVAYADMPGLEKYILHRLSELDESVRKNYAEFDFKRIFAALNQFMTVDLSAFYFDIRKDALYCDPISSVTRKACLTVIDQVFRATVAWLAPMLCFTAEEAYLSRYGNDAGTEVGFTRLRSLNSLTETRVDAVSVHLDAFPEIPAAWRDEALARVWSDIRRVRRVVTGALEIARADKRIGSSLEAAPAVYISDPQLLRIIAIELAGDRGEIGMAEIAITSGTTIEPGEGPTAAFRLDDVPGVTVEFRPARGVKCARSWKIQPDVGADPDYPDVTPRDARALREWDAAHAAAG